MVVISLEEEKPERSSGRTYQTADASYHATQPKRTFAACLKDRSVCSI